MSLKLGTTNIPGVRVACGGGGSGINIGVENPKANLLSMIYGLENGTIKTGTFTLAQTLPNTATILFDAQDTSVKNFAIFAEGVEGTAGSTNTSFAFLAWLQSDTLRQIFALFAHARSDASSGSAGPKNNVDISIETSADYYNYAYWDWINGVLSAKGRYNHQNMYTPFAANTTYRWVAW